jgi:RimJ/RimL family protein N-acetyltransferase
MKPWHRFTSKVREVGLPYTLQLLVERFVPRILLDARVVYLCELDLSDALTANRPDPEIHLAEAEEFDHLVAHHEVVSTLQEKLGPGVLLWLLGRSSEIEAFMWLNSKAIQPSHWIRFELAPNEIAGIFLWVSPDRRGAGLGPRMNRHVSHESARSGFTRIVSTVDALNRNSLRADEKVGYRRIGKVFIIRILGFGGVFCRGVVRLGWWTTRRPLALPVAEIERSLRGAG